MDSVYAMEVLTRQRLAEAEKWAEHERLVAAARLAAPGLREILGAGLIRLGTAMIGGHSAPTTCSSS